MIRRGTHLSTEQPSRAGRRAGKTTPKDALKIRRSGTILSGSSGVLPGPVSVASRSSPTGLLSQLTGESFQLRKYSAHLPATKNCEIRLRS